MNTQRTKRAAGTAGILLALALTASGCAGSASAGSTQGETSQSASAAAVSPAATESATPAATADAPDAAGPATGKYDDAIVLDSYLVKPGDTLHVSGGSLPPGITVKVYASEVGTLSYDPDTDMYSGSPEVIITGPVNRAVDAQGHFDTDLVIPAGTAPQDFNVQLILPDGNGHLVRAIVV